MLNYGPIISASNCMHGPLSILGKVGTHSVYALSILALNCQFCLEFGVGEESYMLIMGVCLDFQPNLES